MTNLKDFLPQHIQGMFVICTLITLVGLSDVRAQSAVTPSCNGIPYNIDADCNGMINAQDLLAFLPYYEFEFVANIDSLSLDLEYANDTLFLLNLSGALIDAVELGFADGAQGPQGDPGMDGDHQGILTARCRSRHGRRSRPATAGRPRGPWTALRDRKGSPAWTALRDRKGSPAWTALRDRNGMTA